MNNLNEISDKELNSVFGGSIDYMPSQPGSKSGAIGINQNYTHHYNNEDLVFAYIAAHFNDKVWRSVSERDGCLFQGLIDAGLIF